MLTQIHFNGSNFFNARIFCLTRGLTRSWRNGDAQCCQLSNIADPFSDFFPFKKAPKPSFWESPVLPRKREVLLSQRAHPLSLSSLSLLSSSLFSLSLSLSLSPLSLLCSVSVQRAAERSSALIQLNTDIILLL